MGFPISHIGCWSERATHASQESFRLNHRSSGKNYKLALNQRIFLKFTFCISKLQLVFEVFVIYFSCILLVHSSIQLSVQLWRRASQKQNKPRVTMAKRLRLKSRKERRSERMGNGSLKIQMLGKSWVTLSPLGISSHESPFPSSQKEEDRSDSWALLGVNGKYSASSSSFRFP